MWFYLKPHKRTKRDGYIYIGMEKRLKLYLADIEDEEGGLLRLSLVRKPATGCPCRVLSVGEKYVRVFAPIIVTNRPIYRKDDNMGEYNLLFLPDVVKDIQDKSAIKTPVFSFDSEHNQKEIKGVNVVKSWLIDYEHDTLYSYYSLPDGSWVMELLIEKETLSELFPDMVFCDCSDKTSPQDFFGISISAILTYKEVSLAEAIEIYNTIRY